MNLVKNKNRVGETSINDCGTEMTIIHYYNNINCTVRFEDGYIRKNVVYCNFKKGRVKSPYDRTVYGVGYLGDDDYSATTEGEITHCYRTWKGMIERCYSSKRLIRYPAYKNCTVYEEWHNFQNFAKWYEENIYQLPNGEQLDLDKDMFSKGCKIYSPKTCVFLPQSINLLIPRNDSTRDSLPIGVTANGNKYQAKLNIDNKQKYLGGFDTPEEAFEIYKIAKEKNIKMMADRYKSVIPARAHRALYDFEVKITD